MSPHPPAITRSCWRALLTSFGSHASGGRPFAVRSWLICLNRFCASCCSSAVPRTGDPLAVAEGFPWLLVMVIPDGPAHAASDNDHRNRSAARELYIFFICMHIPYLAERAAHFPPEQRGISLFRQSRNVRQCLRAGMLIRVR